MQFKLENYGEKWFLSESLGFFGGWKTLGSYSSKEEAQQAAEVYKEVQKEMDKCVSYFSL